MRLKLYLMLIFINFRNKPFDQIYHVLINNQFMLLGFPNKAFVKALVALILQKDRGELCNR